MLSQLKRDYLSHELSYSVGFVEEIRHTRLRMNVPHTMHQFLYETRSQRPGWEVFPLQCYLVKLFYSVAFLYYLYSSCCCYIITLLLSESFWVILVEKI